MKFFALLKKEIRDLLSIQALIGIGATLILFLFIGTFINDIGTSGAEFKNTVAIAVEDNSEFTEQMLEYMSNNGTTFVYLESANSPQEYTQIAIDKDVPPSVVVIPDGFGESVLAGSPLDIELIDAIESLSIVSLSTPMSETFAYIITDYVSRYYADTSVSDIDYETLVAPIPFHSQTVVADRVASIDSTTAVLFASQQTLLVPIIIFMLVLMSAQFNASSIANEKSDKTLQTLLTTPVSRMSIIGAKMCASALFSIVSSLAYMIGFTVFANNSAIAESAGDITASSLDLNSINYVMQLGLVLDQTQVGLLGVQLFLSILIGLSISIIIGAVSKDLKSSQGLIAPLMFMVMIPYMVSMLSDFTSLSTPVQILLSLIPFTHTFNATSNLLFDHNFVFYAGLVYQILFCVGTLFVAVRLFSGDKILTTNIDIDNLIKKKSKTTQD